MILRTFLLLSIAFFGISCKASKSAANNIEIEKIAQDTFPKIHEYSSLHGKKDLKGVPIMHFEQREQDLGMVKKGEKKQLEFPFKNMGDTDLSIAMITACECTSTNFDSELKRKTYKPGESGILKVTFDSSEKDYSELIDIEIILDQAEPGTDEIPIFEKVYYKFDIEK